MTKQGHTLKELAEITGNTLVGDPTLSITNVDNLEGASSSDASFLANPRYNAAMKKSQAGVICVSPDVSLEEGKNFLVSDNPSRTFQQIAELVHCDAVTGFPGIHPSAVIHESAKVGNEVTIGPNAVVEQGATIGDGTVIYASTYIGATVSIGKDCLIYPGAIVREGCQLHDRVTLQPGAVIGSCGFGLTTDPKTGRHTRLEQLGTVILEDDVEIGANTTVDRARFKTTLIKRGTKIDNLVQIAHNVELGENNIIVSQSGIAGSTTLGNNVVLGGQAGVVGHLKITDNVMIATRGGVSKSITKSGVYGGGPVQPMGKFNKQQVLLRNIEQFVKEIKELKKRVAELEKD